MSDFQEQLKAGAARKYDDETLKRELLRVYETALEGYASLVLSYLKNMILERQKKGIEYTKGDFCALDLEEGEVDEYGVVPGIRAINSNWRIVPANTQGARLLDEAAKVEGGKFNLECREETGLSVRQSRGGGFWEFYFEGTMFVFDSRPEDEEKRFLFFKWKKKPEVACFNRFSNGARRFLDCLWNLADEEGIKLGMRYRIMEDVGIGATATKNVEEVLIPGNWDLNFKFPVQRNILHRDWSKDRRYTHCVILTYSVKL